MSTLHQCFQCTMWGKPISTTNRTVGCLSTSTCCKQVGKHWEYCENNGNVRWKHHTNSLLSMQRIKASEQYFWCVSHMITPAIFNTCEIALFTQISNYPHYDDVIMTMLASQITSLAVVYSIVYSGVNQRKHQSSASLAFVREIHRGPVNFPHKWPVTRKMFPFDDVIMNRSLPVVFVMMAHSIRNTVQ